MYIIIFHFLSIYILTFTGLKLYRLIKESGLTYAEIAEYLELQTPRVIYDWINGNKLPSTENLYNLAELFNVQIEDILAF